MLVKSIFCPCFLCAVLLQSRLCKALNRYPLKRGGDEQGNVKNNEMPLSLRGSSIDQPWRELVMRPTLPRENSNSLPLCSPPPRHPCKLCLLKKMICAGKEPGSKCRLEGLVWGKEEGYGESQGPDVAPQGQ